VNDSTGTPFTWTLPRRLAVQDVDDWLSRARSSSSPLRLRIGASGCQGHPGAAAHLQGALCLVARSGRVPELTVPPLTFASGRVVAPFAAPGEEPEGAPSPTPTERALSNGVLGLVLGQVCRPALGDAAAARVAAAQQDALKERRGVFGHGRGRALCSLSDGDNRTRLGLAPVDRHRMLEQRVGELLTSPAWQPNSRRDRWFEQLVSFALEATENTFDHARLDFEGRPIRQVRFVSADRVHLGTAAGATPVDVAAPDPESALRRYAELAVKQFGHHSASGRVGLRLVTLTVADGGVGVAARMTGGLNVYEQDPDFEFKFLQEALLPEGTTKPSGEAGRGQGLKKMLRAAYRLDGLFEMRSGRFSISRTYLGKDGSRADATFAHRDSAAFDVHRGARQVPLVAGTSVSLTFPQVVARRSAP
jgi:hypothetical protein